VERTLALWQQVRGDGQIAGIVSPKDMGGTSYMKDPPRESSLMALYNRGRLVGETMLVFRRAVLAEHLFPVVEGERFMSECVVYHQIDRRYRLAVQNEYLYRAAYQEDGLTRNIREIQWKNPQTTLIMYRAIAAWQTDLLAATKAYGAYLAWKKERGLSPCRLFPVRPQVAAAGLLLWPHYRRIFRREKKQYRQP
jgi:hypothetical protein